MMEKTAVTMLITCVIGGVFGMIFFGTSQDKIVYGLIPVVIGLCGLCDITMQKQKNKKNRFLSADELAERIKNRAGI